MTAWAWVAALVAVAVPNLFFAWMRRRVGREQHPLRARPLSARQRRCWKKASEVAWLSQPAAFLGFYLIGFSPGDAFFWSVVTLGIGLNVHMVFAVVWAILVVWHAERGEA